MTIPRPPLIGWKSHVSGFWYRDERGSSLTVCHDSSHRDTVMSERTAKTLRTTPEEWRRVMGVNLDGVHHVVQAFAPGMAARRDGRIVTVSACLGRMSGPGTAGGLSAYRVSKAAVNAYTKNLAAELGGGRRGVLVDATCPAHCRTDMGGPDAPRSAEQGAATAVWLAARPLLDGTETGVLWEDRDVVPW